MKPEINNKPATILIADDDHDDLVLVKEAFEENHLNNNLRFVRDGEELMDYLLHRGKYTDRKKAPKPGMILLDLNMPKKDGREALKELKSDSDLRSIPVVVLTTSRAEEDIIRTYDLGVNSFLSKPATFAELLGMVEKFAQYWFETAELPIQEES